jgi:hypothetical protein
MMRERPRLFLMMSGLCWKWICAANAQTAWMLEDTSFAERLDFGQGIHAFIFRGKGRAVAAISSSPVYQPFRIPQMKGVQGFDLFGNPLAPDNGFEGRVIYLEAEEMRNLKQLFSRLHSGPRNE